MYGVKCPGCAMEMGYIVDLSGKQVSCPKCGREFVMRQPDANSDGLPKFIMPSREDILPAERAVANRRSRSLSTWIPRSYRVPLAVGACILLLGVAVKGRVFDGLLPDPAAPRVIHDFHGTGSDQTPIFTVRNDWGIEWEVRGAIGWIGICDPSKLAHPDDPNGDIVQSILVNGEPQGKAIRYQGGRYFLKTLYAQGPWRIRVYQYPGRL